MTAVAIAATPAHADTPAPAATQKAVLDTVQRMLEAMPKHDKAAMLSTMMPDGSATLFRDGKFVQMSLAALADRLTKPASSSPDRIEERIHDAVVHVDDNVASVWAPYEFLRNGKIDHCGTDILVLGLREGHWQISSLADNSRKTCGK